MRLIKLGVISFLVLAILVTAIASLFPSTVIVSRAIEVNAGADSIAKYCGDLNGWKAWMSDLKQNEPVWKDSTVYIGTQTIKKTATTNHSATFQWLATGQRPYIVKIEWIFLKQGIYVIHWSFEQHVKWYPWEKFQTLLNEKVLGAKMEMELGNLRDVLLQQNN
jgi:hypothetical protein